MLHKYAIAYDNCKKNMLNIHLKLLKTCFFKKIKPNNSHIKKWKINIDKNTCTFCEKNLFRNRVLLSLINAAYLLIN